MRRRHSVLGFAGSVHFVTIVTQVRGRWFIDETTCVPILEMLEGYRRQFDLVCYGYVLMPDHLHAVLYQRQSGSMVSDAVGAFKRMTSLKCKPATYPKIHLWCESFDDVPVPGPDAIRTKLIYMHENPVKAGLCESAFDYLWSSAQWVATGEAGIITLIPNPI